MFEILHSEPLMFDELFKIESLLHAGSSGSLMCAKHYSVTARTGVPVNTVGSS